MTATSSPDRQRLSPARVLFAVTTVLCGILTFGVAKSAAATPSTPYDLSVVEAPVPQDRGGWAERNAAAGDLTGDGIPDIFVGDPAQSVAGVNGAGEIYLLSGADRSVRYEIHSPEIQTARFGQVISVLGDVNGDGKDDVAVGTDAQHVTAAGTSCQIGSAGCNTRQGKAWVFSGATGRLLYALNDPNPQPTARFGSRIGRAGDVNGDGKPDILVGASGEDSPASCSWNPATGQRISPVPSGCHQGQGQAFIFSGANGSLIRTLDMPAEDQVSATPTPCKASCGSFGLAVQSPGDVNGDGVLDQLVDAGSYSYNPSSTPPGAPCNVFTDDPCNEAQGRMYLFSGKDGALIRKFDDPEPTPFASFFGFQDAAPLSPGDVNGDGIPDIYGNGFDQVGPGGYDQSFAQGKAWVFSGKTGAVLYELNDPTPSKGGQFGWSMAKTDYNHDFIPDLYIGQAPHDVQGSDQSGGTYVFNGIDGSLLKSLELPPQYAQHGASGDLGSNLGWSIAAPGDLNGDGEPDYIAGSPFSNVDANGASCDKGTTGCKQDQGREFVFLSHPPASSGGGATQSSGLAATGTSTSDVTAPGVSGFGVTNSPFVVGSTNTPPFGFAARRRHQKGTTFTYTLSEAATVRIVIAERRGGRRRGKRCVAPTRTLRRAHRCMRVLTRGNLVRVSHQGANRVAFSGRIGSKALTPGRYQATLTATDASGNTSKPKTSFFTIVRR